MSSYKLLLRTMFRMAGLYNIILDLLLDCMLLNPMDNNILLLDQHLHHNYNYLGMVVLIQLQPVCLHTDMVAEEVAAVGAVVEEEVVVHMFLLHKSCHVDNIYYHNKYQQN